MAMVSRPENWQQIVDELLEILGASDSLLQEESWEHLSERHLNIYIYICHIYIYICMYVCMYVCIYIYIHTDIKAYDLRMSKKYSTTHTHTLALHWIFRTGDSPQRDYDDRPKMLAHSAGSKNKRISREIPKWMVSEGKSY